MKRSLVVSLSLSALSTGLPAQTLADRIANASVPRVQFTYASRADVCGNGRSFIQVTGDSWYGSFNDADRRDACVAGTVRVLLDRAGRQVVGIATYVGPVPPVAEGVADLGRVSAREASGYLLGLAEAAGGRVSRDAILPAALADSVDVASQLLAIAGNQSAARETRTTAISWLRRPLEGDRDVNAVAGALVSIARDEDDNRNVRQSALRALARLEHGTGTNALVELTRNARQSWLAREALTSLTSSSDPRARQHLRDVVRSAELSDDVLVAAIRGLGGGYATGEDIKLIRETYAKMRGDRSREAAISAIGAFAGSENVRWLLALARNPDEPISTRRRAVQHAYRGGTPVAEIIKVYDETTDNQLKDAVMNTLVESGEKQATDKLMQIARMDVSPQMRRKAISHLSRSSDERVKQFLLELAGR